MTQQTAGGGMSGFCVVVLCKVQFSLETDSCCGNGNKLVVAWAFPRDHIGVVGTVVT